MAKENTPAAREVYADIIDLPHHQSTKRKHMNLHDRAAQFAPFAALTGYDEMVSEEARLTEQETCLGESDLDSLNRQFSLLAEALDAKQRPQVSVLVFRPDARKSGGRYETVIGRVRWLDPAARKLILLTDGSPPEEITLDLDRILGLSFSSEEDPG